MTGPGRGWLLLPAALSLLAGLDAGLVRLGGPAPGASERLPVAGAQLLAATLAGLGIGSSPSRSSRSARPR